MENNELFREFEKNYFLIKKNRAWYIISGLIAVIVLITGVNLKTLYEISTLTKADLINNIEENYHESSRIKSELTRYLADSKKTFEETKYDLAARLDFDLQVKQEEVTFCNEKEVFLGARSEYLLWTVNGIEIYRHGCNRGTIRAFVELKNNKDWYLILKGGSDCKDPDCGASGVTCKVIGIKLINK